MEIPEHLKRLVDDLGDALVRALVEDPRSRELAQRLQMAGYELSLSLEASPALEEGEDGEAHDPSAAWSEADRAFLRTFRIKLDE